LQLPFVNRVVERQFREPRTQAETLSPTAAVYEPINEADAKSPEDKRLVHYQELVPKARLLPALKHYLSSNRTAGMDVQRLVKQIALQQLPRYLPRCYIKSWHPEWVVVLDFTKRLWPYRQDMHALAENLLKACGQSGVSIRIINHGPLQHWTDWVEEQQGRGVLPSKHTWRMPVANTPVLLVSDLGLLEGRDSSTHQTWQDFIRQLTQAQIKPLALLPLAAEQLDAGLPKKLTLLRWSPDARIHPERAMGSGVTVPDGLDDLLAMAAVTRRVDPPLLRALRCLNPKAPFNAGLEGAFWCHADVDAGSAAQIHHEVQAKHQAHFFEHLQDCHLDLEQLRYQHHAHLRAVLNHEETLLWYAHAKLDGVQVSEEIQKRLQKADTFMRQLAATLKQPDGLRKGGVWWSVAQEIIQRADNQMGKDYIELLAPLVQAIAEVRGVWQQPPDWVDPADLVGDWRELHSCWLVNDPVTSSMVLQSTPPERNQIALAEFLIIDQTIDQGGLRIESAGLRILLSISHLPYRLCGLQEQTLIKLTSSQETLTLASVNRPRGTAAWGWDASSGALWVRSAQLCGQSFQWSASGNPSDQLLKIVLTENGQYQLVENQLSSQIKLLDIHPSYISYDYENTASRVRFVLDEYGVRADLSVITSPDELIQTFRWIEPGTFWMGSPEDELERDSNESPRHEVTISRGFWLADSACTQALWQAVMGNNPSRFKDDPQQPVEQVSWHDVQAFLQRLQELLPGCQVDLPSEAEWEYACRAGTQSPFSFGANINPQQVNYNGQYSHSGGEKGEYRAKTVLVKSLPANAWGLYEMHGNVLEWCKDVQRTYDEQAQIDPLGPMTGDDTPRCLRGGSWYLYARRARSANRRAFQPVNAFYDVGFRFCLRSIESGQVTGSPAGKPGRATGGSLGTGRKGVKSKYKPDAKPKHRS
jgi:formylglycine-generating enzyme required for sulfatase activity